MLSNTAGLTDFCQHTYTHTPQQMWHSFMLTFMFLYALKTDKCVVLPVGYLSQYLLHLSMHLLRLNIQHAAHKARSVAAGFGRHGMPPPASNNTGTALGEDGSD